MSFRLARLLVAALVLLLALPLLRAPLFGEDVLSVWFFARDGMRRALEDCWGTMFGLTSVRFYRPTLSLSLGLQTLVSFDPLWLRSANLAAWLAGVLATMELARRLGARPLAFMFVGVVAALFPGGPQDWCWIVGRVDAFSFGFGMAGLAVFASGRFLALSSLLLVLALFSKETAIALAPAVLAIGFALDGTRGVRRALVPCAALAAAFVVRFAALRFTLGGYVGAPAGAGALLAPLHPGVFLKAFTLATGMPSYVLAALLVLCAIALRGPAGPIRAFAAVLFAAAVCYVPAAFGLSAADDPPPVHARVFPLAYALGAVALGLALDAALVRAQPVKGLAMVAAVVLLVYPARTLARTLDSMREAAQVLSKEQQRLEGAARALPPEAPMLLAPGTLSGWPPAQPVIPLHNLGLEQRFVPPFGPSGLKPVWPLGPAGGIDRGQPVVVAERSPLARWIAPVPAGRATPGLVRVPGPPPPLVSLREGAFPATLTGADATAMLAGTLDRPIDLPPVAGATILRVSLFTPFGSEVGQLLVEGATWKRLLTAPLAGGGLLYQLPALTADYGADRFLLRLEWLDAQGRVLAEALPVGVAMDPEFKDFVRRTESDPAFGIGR